MLQEAEDNYYITAKYLLELSNRAYELFKSSEVEERRQLIKLVLSNLRVEGKLVRYDGLKPFDTILNYADNQLWLPNPEILRATIEKILRAFENLTQTELLKVCWHYLQTR